MVSPSITHMAFFEWKMFRHLTFCNYSTSGTLGDPDQANGQVVSAMKMKLGTIS